MTKCTPEIIDIVKRRMPKLLPLFTDDLSVWFDRGYKARQKIFGDISIEEHCKQELIYQRYAWQADSKRALEHERFENRMFFQGLARRRAEYIEYLEQKGKSAEATSIENRQNPAEPRPVFKEEAIPEIFLILKGFFQKEKQEDLHVALSTGALLPAPLTFMDNGNRLADTFRKLKEGDLIVGEKKVLQSWIAHNFVYRSNGKIRAFTADYLEKCISRKDHFCKQAIIEVRNGLIIKV